MILQAAKMALKAIWSSKLRSFLTMLGIIIGVFTLVVLVSLVNGASDYITGTISELGGSYLTVTVSDDKGRPLRLEDLDAMMEDEHVGLAAPLENTTAMGRNGRESGFFLMYGTTPAYQTLNNLEILYGTFLRDTDVDNGNYVAVINESTAEDLMGSTNCVGQYFSLNGVRFRIIGVLKDDEDSLTSLMLSGMMMAYVPYTAAQRVSNSVSSAFSTFYAGGIGDITAEETRDRLNELLLDRFEKDEDAFYVNDHSAVEAAMGNVTDMLGTLLGGIAAISLLVGGIGIMNIMLVSVTERTREIGIRKAIGAGRGYIMLQFLIEALVVSLLGCVFGLVLSWITLGILTMAIDNVTFTMTLKVSVAAIAFSVLIGVLFGLYPANKAARKPPIEALRFSE